MSEPESSYGRGDEEEKDEDDIDETQYIHQKDAVIFAIDVSSTMLATPPFSEDKKVDRDSPVMAALKCASQIMQQRIISSPSDMMGVLLFGTKNSKFQDEENSRGGLQYPNCYLLCDLDVPSAADVKTLRGITREDEEFQDILVPSEEPVSMSNMFFCANQIFTIKAPNFGSRRLFIITDKDDPYCADKDARRSATTRAKDLYDLGVIIELFPISHPGHEFDRTKFYDDVIYRDPAQGDDQPLAQLTFKSATTDGISLLNSLISDINSKQTSKRTLFSHLPFEISPGFKISVKGYNLLQRQKPERKCYIWNEGAEPKLVTGETLKTAAGSGGTVEKSEVKKAYNFGGSEVHFTPEELKKLKDFGGPVLRLLGVKPQKLLEIWAAIKKSTFIYPSEEDYVGSTRVFTALWKKLLKDKLMGVAWFIARNNATPLLVAILPSEEQLDEKTHAQVRPAGLWLYPLPFADDLRPLPTIPKPLEAPYELIDKMRQVVQQLQLPGAKYDPLKYPNPSLQWHYKILQAIALEEDVPEQLDDKTIPKYRQIDKRAGAYIHEWGQILDTEAQFYQKNTYGGIDGTKVKRESEDPETALSRKKVKTEKAVLESMSHDELKKIVAAEGINKYTVVDLKNFLNAKGLSASGKKPDLVERVEQWVEDN